MSNSAYKFAGRVVAVGKTERMGKDPSRPFTKRTLVVDDAGPNDKYPNPVPFEATGDRCGVLDSIRVGSTVEVAFRLNGREWKDKQGQTRWFGANRLVEVKAADAPVPEIPMAVQDDAEVDDMPF